MQVFTVADILRIRKNNIYESHKVSSVSVLQFNRYQHKTESLGLKAPTLWSFFSIVYWTDNVLLKAGKVPDRIVNAWTTFNSQLIFPSNFLDRIHE